MPSRSFNRLLWAVMLAAIAVLGLHTRDNLEMLYAGVGRLEVKAEPGSDVVRLVWRGQIEAPMAARLSEAFAQHKATARTFVLSLSSPGGSLGHGGEVVRLLRQIATTHKLETVVEAGRRCASMCVPVFLQGQRRSAAAGAKFMFHEVSFREPLTDEAKPVPATATARATDQLFVKYFTTAGVPEAWIARVRADMAGGNDVWKTAQELIDENAGIVDSTL